MDAPEISIVIPVFNEEAGLPALFERLYPALDALGRSYELILVDDGSRDGSVKLLREQFGRRSDVTRVVLFAANFGQHMAILAGFRHALGETVVTLDADLQNPPEEIPKLLAKIAEGFDYVGSYRTERQDSAFRRIASAAMNRLRENLTRIRMTDQGCMLRAYARNVIDAINESSEANTFVPALAYIYARHPTEVEVRHEGRAAGSSHYPLARLVKLNFDLITGFSVKPLQMFAAIGMLVAVGSITLYTVVLVYQMTTAGPVGAVEHVWDRDILEFFLMGLTLFGIGFTGEYIGRIYEQVRGRPRYLVRAVLEAKPGAERWQPRHSSSRITT
ncbi:MAG TPA: glycosyltransferase [Burkholderiales bacterium]|nr:glycosyltransferase [Burkholderiales bacterium]